MQQQEKVCRATGRRMVERKPRKGVQKVQSSDAKYFFRIIYERIKICEGRRLTISWSSAICNLGYKRIGLQMYLQKDKLSMLRKILRSVHWSKKHSCCRGWKRERQFTRWDRKQSFVLFHEIERERESAWLSSVIFFIDFVLFLNPIVLVAVQQVMICPKLCEFTVVKCYMNSHCRCCAFR